MIEFLLVDPDKLEFYIFRIRIYRDCVLILSKWKLQLTNALVEEPPHLPEVFTVELTQFTKRLLSLNIHQ